MKSLRSFILFLSLLATHLPGIAQEGRNITQPAGPDPEKWHVSMTKLKGQEFELTFHLELDKGWHVFVKKRDLNKALIAPMFTFDKNDGIVLEDETVSKGIIETHKVEGIGPVDMYSYKVVYKQKFIGKPGSTISGNYRYQVSDDKMAYAPKTKTFNFKIPGVEKPVLADNSKWTFNAKKKKGKQYELTAQLVLEKGWYVYPLKPGPDKTILPLSITFDKNPKVKLTGKIKETGKQKAVQIIEGTKIKLNVLMDKVTYTQKATITGPTTITGEYTYQVGTGKSILPPLSKKFSIKVGAAAAKPSAKPAAKPKKPTKK